MLLRAMLPLGLMLEMLRWLVAQAHRDGTVTPAALAPKLTFGRESARAELQNVDFGDYDPAAGARTTNGTAGKYAAISERDLRSVAVP